MTTTGPTQELTSNQAASLLDEVAQRNSPLLVELKSGSTWLSHKSRFLGVEPGRRPMLWIETPRRHGTNEPVELVGGQAFLVAFSRGPERYQFASQVVRTGMFHLAGGANAPGLLIAQPDRILRIQRRQWFRQEIPVTCRVDLRLWDGGMEFRDQAADGRRPVYRGRLVNVSQGGLALRLARAEDPRLAPGDLVGVQFALEPGDPAVIVDAEVRRYAPAQASGQIEMGLRFLRLADTHQGRLTLDYLSRTIARMQQKDLRRHRLRP